MTASYIAMIIAATLLAGMAVDILLNSTTKLNRAATVLIIVIAVILGLQGLRNYILITGFYTYAPLIQKMQHAILFLLPPALFFFIQHYPRGLAENDNRKNVLIVSGIFLVFAAISLMGWDIDSIHAIPIQLILRREVGGVIVKYNILNVVLWIILVGGVLANLVILALKYRQAKLIYQQKQIRYFLFGSGIILILFLLMRIFEFQLPSLVKNIILAGIAVSFAAYVLYSVTSFKIINIRKAMLRLLRVFLLDMMIALPFVSLFLLIRNWISAISIFYFFLVLTPAFVILFRVYNTLMNLSSRIAKRKKDVVDLTEHLLDEIGRARNMEDLAEVSVERLLNLVNASGAAFLMFSDKTENFEILYSSSGEDYSIPGFDPLLRHLEQKQVVYDREVILLDPWFGNIREMSSRYFDNYDCQLMVPLYIENQVSGMINIKENYDSSAFSKNDKLKISKFAKVVEVLLNNLILSFKEQEAKLTNKDLSLASQIQESIFQKQIPEFPHMDVYAYQKPAKWVNGDYYLVEKVDENKMGLIIADVSGKGVPAALISMVIHSVSRSQNFSATTTNAIVSKINEVMTSHMSEKGYTRIMSFATLFCAFLDRRNKTLFYTNAAHFPMIIHDHNSDEIFELKANAKPLGIFADQEFYTETFDLGPHQTLVLYSDGIIEANNNAGEEFTREKLIDIVQKNKDLSAEEMSDLILDEVETFAEDQEQFDDITLIIVKI